jgi:Arc/MetJ family transcription regulator
MAQKVDPMAIKKTALLLDDELVRQVKELLGTATTTETIAEAMREVIRVRGRARHLERLHRREGMDLDDPEVMRGAWRAGGRNLGDPPR